MKVTGLYIKLMIRKYGMTVEHRRKTTIDKGGGLVEYEWTVMEPIRGQFNQITPYDTTYNRYGAPIDADYIGTFLPDADIEEGDQLYVNDNWLEVDTKFPRKTGDKTDYIEILFRRKK